MKSVKGFIRKHVLLSLTAFGLVLSGALVWALHPDEVELFELSEQWATENTLNGPCEDKTDQQGQDYFFTQQEAPCDSTNAVINDSGAPGDPLDPDNDDWETIYADLGLNTPAGIVIPGAPVPPATPGDYLVATGIIVDHINPDGTDDSMFTTGGSKDVNDISQWMHTITKPTPDKDNILHAFAALYRQDDNSITPELPPACDDPEADTTGIDCINPKNNFEDIYIYFGMDRLANNGAADLGFWLFKAPINQASDGTFVDDLGNPATQTIGNILILSEFNQGGAIADLKVYEWVGAGGSDGPLNLLEEGADCDFVDFAIPGTSPTRDGVAGPPIYPGQDVCGNVNTVAEVAPWKFHPKFDDTCNDNPAEEYDATDCTFPPSSFYEGGANLTALGLTGCFSNFLAETRSSPSLDAQLKDFVLGEFDTCSIMASKSVDSELSKIGDAVTYTVSVENTGISPLYLESIDDSIAGDLLSGGTPNTGVSNVVANPVGCNALAAQLDPMDTCEVTYDYTVQAGDPDPVDNTVTFTYREGNDGGTLEGQAFSSTSNETLNLFAPDISATKVADTEISKVGDTIGYTITITNDSSSDTPDLVFDTISDSIAGNLLTGSTNTGVSNLVDNCGASLSSATGSCTITYDYTVQPGDADPLVNTVDIDTHPTGFSNDVDTSANESVNLFDPDISATKVADAEISKVGDTIGYTITITNDSSSDTPDLVFDQISDSIAGNLLTGSTNTGVSNLVDNCGSSLSNATGSCTITYDYTVQVGDAEPLDNLVSIESYPTGFSNDVDTSASDSATVLHPDYTLDKSCQSEPADLGTSISFYVTLENHGDVALDIELTDPDLVGSPLSFSLGVATGADDPVCTEVSLDNGDPSDGCHRIEGSILADTVGTQFLSTATGLGTISAVEGLPNELERTDDATCDVTDIGATRTLGFWKSHISDGELFVEPDWVESVQYGYTCHVLEDHILGDLTFEWTENDGSPYLDLGWKQVRSCEDLFSIFWAHPSRESDGGKRNKSCSAQIGSSDILAAALLNVALDNGASIDSQLIQDLIDALESGNFRDIKDAAGPVNNYNESGDSQAIIDLDGTMIPHADPNGGKEFASPFEFGDCD
ncbi:hypothetical protein E2F43_03125 [Seongchinamella unica]|uniref:DUF11 domain-containing protein n=1 Tax=Seongchinamella unica TaxID=2547392 RepID=A0A4R5LV41_9GAMM|nr:hypothetical protein [Seongchinamella unica]TDG15241.1 hypothetical protein E2F43_03125 [Seongchinamella unica]